MSAATDQSAGQHTLRRKHNIDLDKILSDMQKTLKKGKEELTGQKRPGKKDYTRNSRFGRTC